MHYTNKDPIAPELELPPTPPAPVPNVLPPLLVQQIKEAERRSKEGFYADASSSYSGKLKRIILILLLIIAVMALAYGLYTLYKKKQNKYF